MVAKIRIGVVGCGAISGTYMKNLKTFPHVEVVAWADIDTQRAKARAQKFGITRTCTVKELIAAKEMDLVVNIASPKVHHMVSGVSGQEGTSIRENPSLLLGETRQGPPEAMEIGQAGVPFSPPCTGGQDGHARRHAPPR